MKKIEGRWWNPASPDHKAIGTLSICDNDGLRLKIFTDENTTTQDTLHFLAHPSSLNGSDSSCRIVHGQSSDGTLYTLYDGFVQSRRPGFYSLSSATIYFNRGFEGALIDQPDGFIVTRVNASYYGLEQWLDSKHFKVEHERDYKDVVLKFTKPEVLRFEITQERLLSISWTRNGPSQSIAQTRIGIKTKPWISISYPGTIKSDQVLKDVFAISDLLSVLIGTPTAAKRIRLFSADTDSVTGKDKAGLKVLGLLTKPPSSFKKIYPMDFLFTFSSVATAFESILRKWFASQPEWWPFIVPYLAFQRAPASLAERQFFDFASVAESLHSQLHPSELAFPDTEAREIADAIKKVVPKERKSQYLSVLQRVNSLSYQERLTRLLKRFPNLSKDVIGDQELQLKFCRTVKQLRNVEAHRLPDTAKPEVGGLGLIRIAAKLKVIIDAWILAELGLNETVVEERMRSCRKYWFYANYTTWPWDIND